MSGLLIPVLAPEPLPAATDVPAEVAQGGSDAFAAVLGQFAGDEGSAEGQGAPTAETEPAIAAADPTGTPAPSGAPELPGPPPVPIAPPLEVTASEADQGRPSVVRTVALIREAPPAEAPAPSVDVDAAPPGSIEILPTHGAEAAAPGRAPGNAPYAEARLDHAPHAQPTAEGGGTEASIAEHPIAERPTTEGRAVERATAERPAAETSSARQSTAERPQSETIPLGAASLRKDAGQAATDEQPAPSEDADGSAPEGNEPGDETAPRASTPRRPPAAAQVSERTPGDATGTGAGAPTARRTPPSGETQANGPTQPAAVPLGGGSAAARPSTPPTGTSDSGQTGALASAAEPTGRGETPAPRRTEEALPPPRVDTSRAADTPPVAEPPAADGAQPRLRRAGDPATTRSRVTLENLAAETGASIRLAARGGLSSARINLAPPELGQIEIRLRYRGGAVLAELTAESVQASQALARASNDLRRSLEEHGIVVLSVDVRQAGPEARSDNSQGRDHEPSGSGRPHGGRSEGEGDAAPVTSAPHASARPAGIQIDVLA